MEEDKLYRLHCGSSQLVANKKGFGAGKTVTGALLTGGIGLLAGFIGSGDVKVACLKCGHQWSPGQLRTTPLSQKEIESNTTMFSNVIPIRSEGAKKPRAVRCPGRNEKIKFLFY